MAKAAFFQQHGANFLLDSLPDSEYRELVRQLERASVEPGQTIYSQGGPIDYLYFPITAVLSLIGVTRHGERAEAGFVGREGVLGIPRLLGADASPFDAQVTIAGEVLRAQADRVKEMLQGMSSLQSLLLRYAATLHAQVAQSGLCGLYHTVDQRLCRWLLTAHDRLRGDELMLTQDTLAVMIGARRPTVSIASGTLQESGLIRVGRGRITVLDRAGIEKVTCDCYWVIRRALGLFLRA